jgi:hypothetical protein
MSTKIGNVKQLSEGLARCHYSPTSYCLVEKQAKCVKPCEEYEKLSERTDREKAKA